MLKVSSGDHFGPSWGVEFEFFRSEIFLVNSTSQEELFLKKSVSYLSHVER